MTKAKILIVEDEPYVAQDLKIHLEHAGYEVLGLAASGEAALASAAESRPDLVLMDIVLEGQMDGIQAAQQIRSRFDVPVLYLTAYADDHLFQRAKITEPYAYLLKPFNERELQLTIEMALYRHRMESSLRASEARMNDEQHQREIIARERVEQALLASEERFRMLFAHAPVGFAIVGKDYKFAEANQAMCAMLGYSLGELQNKTFGDVTYRDDLEADLDLAGKLFNGEISSYKLEKRLVRKNGEAFWVDLTVTVIHDEQGGALYGLGIVQDITERMQMEASRLEHEATQRNTLVREVHHRIKNNLQGVVGLLRQHVARHPKVKNELEAAIARINSIAMVNGLQSEDTHEQVRLCDLVCGICSSAQLMMGAVIEPIVEVDVIRPVKVTKEEAVPIALILNELIYNAIKHSQPDKTCQPIQVFMGGDENVVEVRVQNRCASLPAGFDFAAGKGLGTGLGLVKSLLPHKGAQLVFSTEQDRVKARFVLTPPVIVNESAKADGIEAL